MKLYKQFSQQLAKCGWIITDESHESESNEPGRIYPHYYKYIQPNFSDDRYDIEMVCDSNKDGTPGRILKLWQGGRPCRV